jgi:Fic family protein
MTDLINWYNSEEEAGRLTPIELAALFHYRYIRIHPFEDGNGRIARLMVNYILARHGLPMIVVRSRKKQDYLEALHQADLNVGKVPSDGAHARINDIAPFLQYFQGIVANEIYHDYLFVTRHDENIWWYDGEMIEFRTPNYAKLLRLMQTQPTLTLEDMQEALGISVTAIRKLVGQLVDKNYVEKNPKDSSWRVIITPSNF